MFFTTLYWNSQKSYIVKNFILTWTATRLICYNAKLVIIKKSLRTSSMKSFSSTLSILSNLMYHFSSLEILIFVIIIILPSDNSSYHKVGLSLSQFSYF